MNLPAAPDKTWTNNKSFLIRLSDQGQESVLIGKNIPNSNPVNVGLKRIQSIVGNNVSYACSDNKNEGEKVSVIGLNSLYAGKNNSTVGGNYPLIVSDYLYIRVNYPEVGGYNPYICFNFLYISANYLYVGANNLYVGLNYPADVFYSVSAGSSRSGTGQRPGIDPKMSITQNKTKGELMSASTNALVQDARALLVSTRKYQTQLTEGGVTETEITEIETAITALETRDNAYKNSKNVRHTKTAAQDEQMVNARVLVKKFRTAAKVLFMDDEPRMKEFHVGQAMPRTVREMVNELFYLNETAGKYSETLLTRGIKTADMQALAACHTELAQIDGEQEAARLAQLTTRDNMNLAVDDLKTKLFRIRKTAEIVFINDKSILQEFRTTIPHSKSTTKTDTTTETGTNP